MKNNALIVPNRTHQKSTRYLLLLTILSFFYIGNSLNAQQDPIFECPDPGEYSFEGEAQQTLCQRYYSINCSVQLGAGTPYPRSSLYGSSVTGNVCIIGDFEVDAPFSFTDAIVKIEPGVLIELKSSAAPGGPNGSLLLDNAKLFACEGMWKGIRVPTFATITTKGGTWIEDAEKAIHATGFSTLYIQATRFNRNWIGMELDGTFFAPIVFVFSNNQFTCTSPLSLPNISEISYAGVVLKNASLFTQSNFNLFSDLRYGIYAQGSASSIGASNLTMLRIRNAGIYMEEGTLNLKNSYFGVLHYGINIGLAKLLDVKNTEFIVASSPTNIRRIGINVDKFSLNSKVSINGINFDADMEGTTNKVTGIYLKGGNVGAGTKIRIGNSFIALRAKESHGIYLDGIFPSSSTTEIWSNRFRVSNTTQNPGSGRPSGMEVIGTDINNLSVKWNTFTSYTVHTLPPGTFGPPQWNYGVYLRSNLLGTNNEVSVNGFNYETQTLQFGLIASRFQNTRYCSNTFSGFGFTVGVLFQSTCGGTDFRGNIFRFAGYDALLISENTQIGEQAHKGNQWYNLSGVEPVFHARCQANPLFNKFIVHTPQSTCSDENDPCFNPFHPRKIEPDLMDEFFGQDSNGTPSEGCNDEFTGGGTDELDRQIAQGTFAPPSDDPVMGWVLQRYLYHKFKGNPSLTSEHASFPAFMTSKENTTVGKFYDVHAAIENALKAGANVDAPSAQALSDISGLMEDMAEVDEAIEQQGLTAALKAQKEGLILQIHGRHWAYDSLRAIHEAQVSLNLQTAYNLNQAITTTQAYETNEKIVNQTRLLSLMQQGGKLTEAQVNVLQFIAQQDPRQGGPAVHTALGMLPECARPEVLYEYLAVPSDRDVEYAQMAEDRSRVAAIQEAPGLNISPNPANAFFIVRNPTGSSGRLTLFDISGKIRLQQPFSGQEARVDLKPGTPPGVYLLRFDREDGSSVFKKLIVQSN